jgi:hypothetical protein
MGIRRFPFFPVAFCMVCLAVASYAAPADNLPEGFVQPPASARPHTWWHWMNGNITKEGITADLEAMARVGVGGAQIFNADCGIPEGPVVFGSPEWLALVKHAAREAQRLGIELCIHNCAGWSSSGGPWNTPEHGMKVVVTSEVQAKGPTVFDGKLPQPRTNLDFYRDIAVLAFRTPAGELARMQDANPVVTLSTDTEKGENVVDGNASTSIQLRMPTAKKPALVQLAFAKPFAARMLVLRTAGVRGCAGRIEVSDDGAEFRDVQRFSIGRDSNVATFSFPLVSARFFRLLFTSADRRMRRLRIAEVELSSKVGMTNLAGKTFLSRGGNLGSAATDDVAPDAVVQRGEIVDLTAAMQADGQLSWEVPEGEWTILRLGYTANGRRNHPAPKAGTGLECDKLSKEAAQAHWDGMMGKVLAALGPLAGDVKGGLNNVLIDSYEVGCQNWTQGFAEEFRRRAGYDIKPFLPAFTGRVVDTPAVTERFLWDLRRVIADMFAENYSGAFAEMAHKAGLQYSVEPYGNGPSDDLQYGSYGDIPMSEFWAGSGTSPGNAKLAASVAHVFGRKYVGAESFTASPEGGKWQHDPYSLKAQGDVVYCGGVNRIIYHRYAHQPWLDRFPGMTMGQWGTHFERTNTWWEQGRAWLLYQARCQYLLQEGLFVADVSFYCGEDAPNSLRHSSLPKGYDYDGCDTAALLSMTVRDGRLVLPSGMSYRLLVLPDERTMTPKVARKVGELAALGARIVGPKPERSPSLQGYPGCDAAVKQLADRVWGTRVKEQSAAEALKELGLPPDFVCENDAARVSYIHRRVGEADIYFVASQKDVSDQADCTFRIAGKVPELWHPDTGRMERAPVFQEKDGCTTVPLRFDPAGSVFVVFRQPVSGDHAVAFQAETTQTVKKPVFELKILKAEYGAFPEDVPSECSDVTAKVRASLANGVRRIAATNSMAGGDPAPNVVKELQIDYLVGTEKKTIKVGENRVVELPVGAEVVKALYGLIEEQAAAPEPQAIDVTEKLAALVKDGALRVRADNALAGKDPAYMVVKELRVDYVYKGARKHARVRENQTLVLPRESQRLVPLSPCDLVATATGALDVTAWQPGTFSLTTAAGKTSTVKVDNLPQPLAIAGPWTLSFPSGWGAPARVSLPKLISWTAHEDKGVKYFSGTAIYTKSFPWAGGKKPNERYVLDLGDLRNLAEISVNGRDLGILWKPPFRVDVTDALQAGDNALQIKVTNLWPNRLIGDEQLPPDREWRGIALKEWPTWFLEGKPSPTGRLTFTTWHHWQKNDLPLPSGLFGPVRVWTGKQVAVR